MMEFDNLQDAFNYISENKASMIVTDGETIIVYCTCHDVPLNLRSQNPTYELIYN